MLELCSDYFRGPTAERIESFVDSLGYLPLSLTNLSITFYKVIITLFIFRDLVCHKLLRLESPCTPRCIRRIANSTPTALY